MSCLKFEEGQEFWGLAFVNGIMPTCFVSPMHRTVMWCSRSDVCLFVHVFVCVCVCAVKETFLLQCYWD